MADLSVDSNVSGSFGSVGPVTVSGIPSSYSVSWEKLPTINLKSEPVTGTLTIKPLTVDLRPIETTIRITEIPNVRTHLPVSYTVGLVLFGIEVAAVRVCGEGQVITEPYVPNPCEACGHGRVGRISNDDDQG